ncbi:hypothetical protein BAE44_0010122 [Dichanthelium oligosanthes]|uniref:B3 domain-containing protein n=1 Tax=Dichanthelium oligosanthes TaxID=888268 RepID=A0A1E5VUQ9_9POAL|nr:hypothetical protein BAE44_0010122 [Dichanthelium oligosanthes]
MATHAAMVSDSEFDSVSGGVVKRYKHNSRLSMLQTFNLNSPACIQIVARAKEGKTSASPSALRSLLRRKKMCKRTLAMLVYDPAASGASQERTTKPAQPSADAGAVVPYDVEPIDAVPLKAIALRARPRPRPRRAPALLAIPEEPPCLRRQILPSLELPEDLPVHFIDRKRVTHTDVDEHQNRFRIPSDGALGRLRPILTNEELDLANLLHDPAPRPRKQSEPEPQPEDVAADNQVEHDEQEKIRKKRQGRRHGGLPVRLMDLAAGASGELLLSMWESSSGTVVKGEGYMDYIRRCSFKEQDVVEIWAFKQRAFRLFGVDMVGESPLYLLIVKRDGTQHYPRLE